MLIQQDLADYRPLHRRGKALEGRRICKSIVRLCRAVNIATLLLATLPAAMLRCTKTFQGPSRVAIEEPLVTSTFVHEDYLLPLIPSNFDAIAGPRALAALNSCQQLTRAVGAGST